MALCFQSDERNGAIDVALRGSVATDMVGDGPNVLGCSKIVGDQLLLEASSHAKPGSLDRRHSIDNDAIDHQRAGYGSYESRDDVEQRGLAGAVGSDQPGDSCAEFGLEIVQRTDAAELNGDLVDPDHGVS